MKIPRYGLDTGFFFELFDGNNRALEIWEDIAAGEAKGVVSATTTYELQINALKGVLVREDVEELLEELPILCTVQEALSVDASKRAAHIAWGNNMAMADALILQGFLDAEVTRILTTDNDLNQVRGRARR